MKFTNTEVWGFDHALRGMRNPLNSWEKSDSHIEEDGSFCIGDNDMALAKRLISAGTEHRKFLRQIFVSVDITAPLYWWKEFDTYKVGTTANSCSTMHTLASTPITLKCFELNQIDNLAVIRFVWYLDTLEELRQQYVQTQDKSLWRLLIQMLPESWLQTRTVTMTYENILAMYAQRKNHKLTEWSENFINWATSLPHIAEFIEA